MKKIYTSSFSLLLAAVMLTSSGCASIVSKTSYQVPINSDPKGAKITITDFKGRQVHSAETPTTVHLRAGAGYFKKAGYLVKFELEGYDTKTVPVTFDINGWYFGNVLFGGLVGMLIVDPATGAMWKLDTKFVNETLKQTTASTTDPTLELRDINNIPETWKAHLVEVK
jgi:hypothetical protein